jgi:hypothetical protein
VLLDVGTVCEEDIGGEDAVAQKDGDAFNDIGGMEDPSAHLHRSRDELHEINVDLD